MSIQAEKTVNILRAISSRQGATSADIGEAVSLSHAGAVQALARLADGGYVDRDGEGTKGAPYTYRLTPRGSNLAGVPTIMLDAPSGPR